MLCAGIPETREPIAGSVPVALIVKQLGIVGSSLGTAEEVVEVLELAANVMVKAHHRLEPMERLSEEMHSGRLSGRFVLDLQA